MWDCWSQKNVISHRRRPRDREITFLCISLKKNQYEDCGGGGQAICRGWKDAALFSSLAIAFNLFLQW